MDELQGGAQERPLLSTCRTACGIVLQFVGATRLSLQAIHEALAVFHPQAAGQFYGSEMNDECV